MSAFDSVRFTSGRPLLGEITSDKLNAILAEIRKNRPRGERGITVRESGDATYIGLATAIKQGGAPAQRNPWDIYVESSEEDTYTLKVQPGTLGGVLASNWEAEFEASGNGLFYGIAKVTTDGRFVTGVTLEIGEDPPTQQSPTAWGLEEEIDLLFGLFKDGASYNLVGAGNLPAEARLVATAENEAPVATGFPLFDLYYVLQ
jgi:hypothetical protein